MWIVYAYRDLWPLATFTLVPMDVAEGVLLWVKISILTTAAIILPLVSFSADGTVAVVFFIHSAINHILGRKTMVPSTLAKARAIDLSIQFTLFWMPVLILLSWWTGRPLMLLFGESKIFYGHRRFLNELI